MLERAKEVMTRYLDEQPLVWSFLSAEVASDYMAIRGARSEHVDPVGIRHIRSMRACELFCDESPMRLLEADNAMEIHDDLRRKNPSGSPRVSGEIITIGNFACSFIVMDCIILRDGVKQLPTKNQLQQVIPWLISQNIVPLDAEARIIPYEDSP